MAGAHRSARKGHGETLTDEVTHVDPAQRQQPVLVLEAEELLHVLHVAVVWASGLLGNDHVGEDELVVGLERQCFCTLV